MPSRRIERLNQQIRGDISELLLREVRDPRLDVMISVTRVEVSPDLSNARVFVSIMATPEQQTDALKALNAAAAYFHRELKPKLDIRRVPFLVFRLDTSIEDGARVLAQIQDGLPQQEPPAAS